MADPGSLLLEEGGADLLLLEDGGSDALLLEAYYEREIRELMPVGFSGSAVTEEPLPAAWEAPFAVSAQLPSHWAGTKELDLVLGLPAAWSGVYRSREGVPYANAGTVESAQVVPFLIGTPAFGTTERAPVAWRGNLIVARALPVMWSGNAYASGAAPASWAAGVFPKEWLPYEWDGYGTVRAFFQAPLAPLVQNDLRETMPFTFGGLFAVSRAVPVAWARQVQPDLSLPIAWGRSLTDEPGADEAPFYPRLEVAGDVLVPAAHLGSVAQDAAERLSVAKRARIVPVESLDLSWSGFVVANQEIPTEIKATLAQLADIPYDFAVKALAVESIPKTVLRKLVAVSTLPIGKWPEGAILFIEGVDCVWVLAPLTPETSDTWPVEGCDNGES